MSEKTKKSKSVIYYLHDLREGFVDYAHEIGIDAGFPSFWEQAKTVGAHTKKMCPY